MGKLVTAKRVLSTASFVGLLSVAPAHASLIADGLTYTLTGSTISSTEDQFVLGITGINGPSDTEGGRSGVNALAFTLPANFASAIAPAGFSNMAGGLNSSGCDGSGGFFCFSANVTPPKTPALAANSSLSFTFDVNLTAGGTFAGYVPDFKIEWIGSQNNYDLVSLPLAPTGTTPPPPPTVPEPTTLALFGAGLIGLGLMRRCRTR